jgi:cell division septation protein DedD
MDDNSSWKGQGFMLLVFAGIVFLCSIFFVLGMLVGRSQGQKFAAIAASESPAKGAATDTGPGLNFPEPAAPAPPVPPPTSKEESAAEPPAAVDEVPKAPATSINWQIGALRSQSDAEKKLAEVQKLGFRAFIVSPSPNDPVQYYRVQVGPYTDSEEAEIAKKKLEALGMEVLRK